MPKKREAAPSSGWTMGAWAKGQLRRDPETREAVKKAAIDMGAKRKVCGGGRPRTVEHLTGRFCRCAECRKKRGER